jgi:hypothetical protein
MSAAASVPETFPLEGANPCHFLVVYEDAAAYDLAMKVCSRLMTRFEAELPFTFSFWKFKDLFDPASAHWAAETVARADIMLFSLPGHDLAPETSHWLDACVQARTKAEGALAVVLTEFPAASLAVEALLSRLEFAAYRLRMDFLPLLPSGTSADSMPALLPETPAEPGSNHWGLNE